MPKIYEPVVPRTVGEVMELLGWMMIYAPSFEDKTGYFPGQSIETEFMALDEGLKNIRKKVGDEKYTALTNISRRMRSLFEADPQDQSGDSVAGRNLILEMEDLLNQRND